MMNILLAHALSLFLIGSGLPACSTGNSAKCESTEVLTNASIIELVKRGLTDAAIIEKIRCSKQNFDTSPEGLTQLNEAGVSEAVIKEIVASQKKTVVESGTATVNSGTASSQSSTGTANSTVPGPTPAPTRDRDKTLDRVNRSVPVTQGGEQGVTAAPPTDRETDAAALPPASSNITKNRSKRKRKLRRRSQP